MNRPFILDFDKVTAYATALDEYIDELEKEKKFVDEIQTPDYKRVQDELWQMQLAVKIASEIIAGCEKDSCYYCPIHCNHDTYEGCIDPEGRRNSIDGCSAEKWQEFLLNYARKKIELEKDSTLQ